MTTPAANPRPRKLVRRWVLVLGITVAAFAGLFWLATDSFVTRMLVMSRLEAAIGGDVSASGVRIEANRTVTINDFAVRAPGVAGEAGTIFSAKQLVAKVNPWRGNNAQLIEAVSLHEPVVRISRSSADGGVNIAALAPNVNTGGGQGSMPALPEVFVTGGVLEVGEHDAGGAYTVLKRVRLNGRMEQTADASGRIVSFRSEASGGEPALSLQGRVTQDHVSLTLTGLDLGGVTPENVPSQARELLRQAGLVGRIPEASVVYNFAGGWTARVKLEDVAVSLPVEARPADDADGNPIPLPPEVIGRRMRMDHTSGELTLTDKGMSGVLAGMIEELPYEVVFRVDGLSPQSAWSCTLTSRNVRIQSNAAAIRFTPGVVRRRLRDFSDPEGRADVEVKVSRAAVSQGRPPPPVRVEGSMNLRGITAAFHKFPYEWKNLTGRVSFDESSITIHEVRGVGAGGAGEIRASGAISPLNEEAKVDVTAVVTGVPIDDDLARAMAARGQEEVLTELFDAPAATELEREGFIVSGAAHEAMRREVAAREREPNADPAAILALRERLLRPVFDTGGVVNVTVHVTRTPGEGDANWDDEVIIDLPSVGVLPRAFPYPLRGRGVRIVQRNGVATLERGDFVGVRGGNVSIDAAVDFDKMKEVGQFVPTLGFRVEAMPIDDLLVRTLTRSGERTPGAAGTADVIRQLALRGTIDANGTVSIADDGLPSVSATGRIDASAAPEGPGPARLVVSPLQGSFMVDDARARATIAGDITFAGAPPEAQPNPFDVAIVVLRHELEGQGPAEPSIRVHVGAPGSEITPALADLVAPFASGAAASIRGLAARHRPAGRVDLAVSCAIEGGAASGQVRIGRPRGVTLAVPPDDASGPEGAASALLRLDDTADEVATVFFETAGGDASPLVSVRTRTTGEVTDASGNAVARMHVEGSKSLGVDAAGEEITIRLDGLTLESPVVLEHLRGAGVAGVADAIVDNGARGVVDAELRSSRPAGAINRAVTGVIRPRTLALDRNDRVVRFRSVEGEVEVTSAGGSMRGLSLTTDSFSIAVDGGWTRRPDGAAVVDARFAVESDGLDEDLRSLLPSMIASGLARAGVGASGPVLLADAPVRAVIHPDRGVVALAAGGEVEAQGVSAELGARVEDATGTLRYDYRLAEGEDFGRFTLDGDFDSLRVAGVGLTRANVELASLPGGGIEVTDMSVHAYGGRITGGLTLSPPLPTSEAGAAPRAYDLAVEASNVRFAPLLEALRTREGPHTPMDKEPAAPDGSRGVLSGSFALAGVTGADIGRRGRGTFTVRGGNVLSLPLLVPFVRFTNLQLPFQEQLDYAFADFYVQGSEVAFEQLAVSSESVGLYGVGTATWPDLYVDLRIRTGNRARVPFLTSIMESLREELITTVVRGPIDNPQVSTARFSGARRALGDLFGSVPSPEEDRLNRIERRVSDAERRERPEDMVPIEPN
ncbi:MAG TPA: hypothetical protein VD971_03415 [Phycisphaerales bacterium]|nr:hypothetical protein [Phycisphaerales bacterium]